MLKIIRCISCMVLFISAIQSPTLANNYYISVTSGNDTRTAVQARDPATPWRTVAGVKANYALFAPGDSILFMRGEKHAVSDLRPTVSGTAEAPIVFGAYGTGANPILTGASVVTGFSATATPAVFSKTLSSATTIRFVFNNGIVQPLARHPNSGFLYTTSIPSATPRQSFVDNSLPQTTTDYWKGANVGIRFEDWEWFNDSVTSYNASTKQIMLKSVAYGNLRSGWGYYFTNKLEIVDSVGEWYQNGNTLYYDQPAGTDPATISLEIATSRNAFVIRNVSYLHVVNLTFEKYASDVLYADTQGSPLPANNQGLAFINLHTSFAYTRGLELRSSTNTLIRDCSFSDSQYEGVGIEACIGTQMLNSSVLRTALAPGAQYRAGNGIAVRPIGTTVGYANRITGCLIDSSSKHGIRLEDSLTTVERTVIRRSSLTTADIGAIYLIGPYCGKDTIRSCFTSETLSYFGGYPLNSVATATGKGRGLYVDDFAHDVWLENNTSFNNSSFGIHLINGRNCTVTGNLTYGNGFAEINFQEANSRTPRIPAGWCKHDVRNNVFFTTDPQAVVVRQETQDYNGSDFGVLDSNTYHHPTSHEVYSVFRPMHLNEPLTSPPTGQTFKTLALLTLSEFQAFSGGQDLHSQKTTFRGRQYNVTNTLSPNLITNPDFETNLSGWNNESPIDFTLSLVTALNGKSLSYKYTGPTVVNRKNFTYNRVLNADLAIGDYCRLVFTSKATNPFTTLRPFFAQNIAPFGSGGFGRDINARTTATTDTLIFQVTADFKASSVLKFASTIDAGEYLLDDVSLQKVSVTTSNAPAQLLYTNPSATSRTVALDNPSLRYFSLDSVQLTGSITIPAWSSIIVSTSAVPQALPVNLVEYNAVKSGSMVTVRWATASEQSNSHFEVEHSTNTQIFNRIGIIHTKGNSSGRQSYSFEHPSPAPGLNYYRLVQADVDGRRRTYDTKSVDFTETGRIHVFPDPSGATVKVTYPRNLYTQAGLMDLTGRNMQKKKISSGNAQTVFDLSAFPAGVYLIRLENSGQAVTRQFIKR